MKFKLRVKSLHFGVCWVTPTTSTFGPFSLVVQSINQTVFFVRAKEFEKPHQANNHQFTLFFAAVADSSVYAEKKSRHRWEDSFSNLGPTSEWKFSTMICCTESNWRTDARTRTWIRQYNILDRVINQPRMTVAISKRKKLDNISPADSNSSLWVNINHFSLAWKPTELLRTFDQFEKNRGK